MEQRRIEFKQWWVLTSLLRPTMQCSLEQSCIASQLSPLDGLGGVPNYIGWLQWARRWQGSTDRQRLVLGTVAIETWAWSVAGRPCKLLVHQDNLQRNMTDAGAVTAFLPALF